MIIFQSIQRLRLQPSQQIVLERECSIFDNPPRNAFEESQGRISTVSNHYPPRNSARCVNSHSPCSYHMAAVYAFKCSARHPLTRKRSNILNRRIRTLSAVLVGSWTFSSAFLLTTKHSSIISCLVARACTSVVDSVHVLVLHSISSL